MMFISKAMTSKMCLSNPLISLPPDRGGKYWKTSINMPTYIQYILYNFYGRGMSKRDKKPSKLQTWRLFDGVYSDSQMEKHKRVTKYHLHSRKGNYF